MGKVGTVGMKEVGVDMIWQLKVKQESRGGGANAWNTRDKVDIALR
jgi:hypothetical protein